MKDFCDSCTQEADVSHYRMGEVSFWWCENCKEEEVANA
jgi:hypothetical protein